ncbi:HNH endonuclease signature motif containing protein [Geodermatophilus marinus]|uniref:HNH endonuclease signature motif containing protein n=1 Tax=Geodermatophilus sp. LHW52908 TaxID=2303986 RepID=UPI001314A7CC|nr:HNH endonuclease signature motif containing protein [Geodermatophilus sp. LHW52908]
MEARSAGEKAFELGRVQQLKARLAAYEAELIAGLAADRPDSADRRPEQPGAPVHDLPGPGTPDGASEFFADELALVLNCSRTQASVTADDALTLVEKLPATRAALADGRLDWPRARAIARELGWKARGTDPRVIEAVEAAVLPIAGELSVSALRALVIRELLARDADAGERRRRDAEAAADVTVKPLGDGMSELVARMSHPLAVACRGVADAHARAAKAAGDPRPLGVLRVAALTDLVLRPWAVDGETVTAHLEVVAPLDALTPARFLADGGSPPAAFRPPGSAPAPTGSVNGEPITAGHLRELLTQLDSLCPGGLQAPPGGSLSIALTDPDGTLRAVVDRRQLERLARRGCPAHPGGDCGCPVLDRPAPTDAYRPTDAQRLFVRTRDRTCRHPGCGNRAGWADLDHVVPHACGGETDCANLCCLCRRHHRLKTHAPGWLVRMGPDGVLTVEAPSGVTRTSRPPVQHEARGRPPGGTGAPGPPAPPGPDPRRGPPGGRPPMLPVTGSRLLAGAPAPPADPADDPPPF